VFEVSVINPNETNKSWQAAKREAAVQLYLSGVEGDSADLVAARVAGYPLSLNVIPVTDWIDPEELASATAGVIQVDADSPASVKRFQKLAQSVETPLIAAAYDPPLALVRSLIKMGAHDVIPLPLSLEDLETSVAPVAEQASARHSTVAAAHGKLVTVIKGSSGGGATALLSQLTVGFAENEVTAGRDVCLMDLDVQFGDVAFQMGLRPKLSLVDLLEAGTRLDGALLKSVVTEHPSGLKVIAAPMDMMPLESVSADHLLHIVDLATKQFGTVFVDLPSNWTNWSLSLVARSDLVLLVTELTVAGLNRAKRQLKLLESQELNSVDVRIIANRYDKNQARSIRPSDVREALGRDISYTISNDFPLMRAAIDRGVPISDIKRKSSIAKDLAVLDVGIAAALGLER
jgi:pilus assembly protein CpaE